MEPIDLLKMAADFIFDIIEQFLTAIFSVLSSVNPDPFPEMIEGLSFDGSAAVGIAFQWLDVFFPVNALLGIFESWLFMFGLAWGIMTLLKWANAR